MNLAEETPKLELGTRAYPLESSHDTLPQRGKNGVRNEVALNLQGVAVSLLVIGLITWNGCSTEVVQGVDEQQAHAMVSLLEDGGVAARAERDARHGGWMVNVPTGEASQAFEILQASFIPLPSETDWEAVLNESRLIETPSMQRARQIIAAASELEATLRAIPGIVDARLHVAIPEPRGLTLETGLAPLESASLLLMVDQSDREVAESIPTDSAIRDLVAGGVTSLSASNVVISRIIYRADDQPTGPALARIGPLGVTEGSKQPIQAALIGMAGLVLLLAGMLTTTVLRSRRNGKGRS